MLKGRVRNEYRLLWRAGITEGIPAEQLAILEAEYAEEFGTQSGMVSEVEQSE